MARLRTRIEKGLEGVVEEDSICLDMIDTLPQELQTRTEEWFQDRQKSRNYSWRELFDHFSELFGDQQVLEAAVEQFCRIQKGRNQYFHDYIKEFDYKVAMCGGEDTYTPQGK